MFDHFVWSVLVVPILVVGAAAVITPRLSPRAGVSLLTWSAVAASAAALVDLAAFTAKAAAELPAVAARFGWSSDVVIADTAHTRWAPWLSVGLLAYGLGAMGVVARRHRRARRIARGLAALPADQDVVYVESASVDAFAVPGDPGRVVVTTAMRDALTGRQLAALLAHERAHLRARHPRLILLAELAGAASPVLWRVARDVARLMERAADEEAARAVGDRRLVAEAIGAAALAAAGRPLAPSGMSFARRNRPGAVPARVAGLLAPSIPEYTKWFGVVPAVLALSSVVWTFEAVYDLGELLVHATP